MTAPRDAVILAAQTLEWLTTEEELFLHFCNLSGMGPMEIAQSGGSPETLAAVLDFVLLEDAHVLAAASFAGCAPELIVNARGGLPGGDAPHWT